MINERIFVGRKSELAELNSLLGKKSASLIVVKGRRRVGKSRLIAEFAQNKKFYSIRALAPNKNTTAQSQRDEFARQLSLATGLPEVQADDWSKLFILLASAAQSGRIIILLDEISWMGSKDSAFLEKLQNIWESHFQHNSELIMILCGSVSTWIDKNILSSTGYFGRISWEMILQPLSLPDCNQLLEEQGFQHSLYEKCKILSITGGIPWYIEHVQGQYTADDNIKHQAFTKGGVLFRDFDRIFHDLFDSRGQIYKRIIGELAQLSLSYSEIAKHINYESSGRLSEYLDDLISAGFIQRYFTWDLKSGKQSKLSRYRLSDNYLRFYLKYIEPNKDSILQDKFTSVKLSNFPGWNTIMGYQFENLVLQNRKLLWGLINIDAADIVYDNPYFQQQTTQQQACQIDYLIQSRHKTYYLFEIKLSLNPIEATVIGEIQNKISKLRLPSNTACLPILIHVNGVSDSVKNSNFFYKTIDFGCLLKSN